MWNCGVPYERFKGGIVEIVDIRVPMQSHSSGRSDADRHFVFDEEPEVSSQPPADAPAADHAELAPGAVVRSFIQQTYHPYWAHGEPRPHTVEANFRKNIAPVYSKERLQELLSPLRAVIDGNFDDATLREQLNEHYVSFCGLQPAVFLRTLARVIEAHVTAGRS